jgi:hypothetical protein
MTISTYVNIDHVYNVIPGSTNVETELRKIINLETSPWDKGTETVEIDH